MNSIFHITTRQKLDEADKSGEYIPDDFIHCAYWHQLLAVAENNFGGQGGLVLLQIDRSRVPGEVVDENLEGGEELYPHIYGCLPLEAVMKVHAFPSNEDGTFDLPKMVDVAEWPGRI